MPFIEKNLLYIILGLIFCILVISTYAYVTSVQLDAIEAEYNGFKEKQKTLGEVAAANNAAIKKQYDNLKKDTDNAITTLAVANDDMAKRLRDDRTRSRSVSIQTAFAGRSEATITADQLSAALQRYDNGLSELINECTQTAIAFNVVRDWAMQVGDAGSEVIQ